MKNCSCGENSKNNILKSDNKQSPVEKPAWITGYKETKIGSIPLVSTRLSPVDHLENLRVRFGIRRMTHRINPGLYGVGDPDGDSIVVVSANYKMSFDKLRSALSGINAWILVLDTKGVNVWCAAGKGTFGTDELVKRVILSKLERLVNHQTLLLPQLGAVGVSALHVKRDCGFKVVYGPVYAVDLPQFIQNDFKKTLEMRTVQFKLKDRLVVILVELSQVFIPLLIIFAVSGIFSLIQYKELNLHLITDFIPYFGAVLIGIIFVPVFLPLIPTRSFALKGFFSGLLWTGLIIILYRPSMIGSFIYFLILPFMSAFLALNYTGASTFTSLAGAKLEVRYTLPVVIIAIIAGLVLKIFSLFLKIGN